MQTTHRLTTLSFFLLVLFVSACKPDEPQPIAEVKPQNAPLPVPTYRISTIAGPGEQIWDGSNRSSGYRNGTGAGARFDSPRSIARDSRGNYYVGDYRNGVIRKVSPMGEVTLFAGTPRVGSQWWVTDGPVNIGSFSELYAMEFGAGDTLFVADGSFLRKVDPTGTVSTLIRYRSATAPYEGPVDSVQSGQFLDVAVSSTGAVFFVDAGGTPRIRKLQGGQVSTVAGDGRMFANDGPAPKASFDIPYGIALQPSTDYVFISEARENMIRTVAADRVSTVYDAYDWNNRIWRRKDDLWWLELSWITRMQFESDTTLLVLNSNDAIWRLNLQTRRAEMIFPLDHAFYCARRIDRQNSVCDDPKCRPYNDGVISCQYYGEIEDFMIESDSTIITVDQTTHSLRRITRIKR
jgi:hypothetical protein